MSVWSNRCKYSHAEGMIIFNHCYKLRNLILAAFLTIGFASPVLAQQHALFVDLNSKEATDLGTLGGNFSTAHGINDAGQVIGTSSTASGQRHAFIIGPDGTGMTDLGTLGGDESDAFGINDAGQVVGWSTTAVMGPAHAFITGPNGLGMADLGSLGGDYSGARGINDMGQVIGDSRTASGQYHAFITGPDGGMTDLGTLGGSNSGAFGINDAGQLVGNSDTDTSLFLPFVTGPDGAGMTELASLVNPPPGFTDFSYTSAINNHGQLVAMGTAVPEPEVYGMLLLGFGLVGFLARGRATA